MQQTTDSAARGSTESSASASSGRLKGGIGWAAKNQLEPRPLRQFQRLRSGLRRPPALEQEWRKSTGESTFLVDVILDSKNLSFWLLTEQLCEWLLQERIMIRDMTNATATGLSLKDILFLLFFSFSFTFFFFSLILSCSQIFRLDTSFKWLLSLKKVVLAKDDEKSFKKV